MTERREDQPSLRRMRMSEQLVDVPEEIEERKTSSRTCCKRCLKSISVGPLDNGLYFRRKQQYLSVCSGIFTLIGALSLIGIAISIFINILNRDISTAELSFVAFDVKKYDVSLGSFLDQTELSVKVHSYSYWELLPVPLDCALFKTSFDYMVPSNPNEGGIAQVVPIKISCKELNKNIYFAIIREPWQDALKIENAQYFRLEIALREDITPPLII
jgi:hypothetical protein